MPEIGDKILNYVLEERLGRGAFGEVWKARHTELKNERVAIKFFTDLENAEVVFREARVQDTARGPGVAAIRDVDWKGSLPLIVMEYLPGGSLRERLNKEKRISPEESARIALQLARTLSHVHANNIAHLDLKPENLLFAEDGSLRVADFGISRAVRLRRAEQTLKDSLHTGQHSTLSDSAGLGTLQYMSPEQKDGSTSIADR